jgi:hypothetical protein
MRRARRTEDVAHVRVVARSRRSSPSHGHERDAGAERRLDGSEVGVEVRVVELDRREDERPRRVVEELRSLVGVGRRVLVALDHERRAAAERRRAREVRGLAAHEVAGVAAGGGEDPRGERGRRRLAVRPRDHDRVPAEEDLVVECLGHRPDAQAPAQGLEDLGVVPLGEIARDDLGHVGADVLRAEGRQDGDAQGREAVGHRRVEGAVGARHALAAGEEEGGQRGHRGPTHGDQVERARGCGHRARSLLDGSGAVKRRLGWRVARKGRRAPTYTSQGSNSECFRGPGAAGPVPEGGSRI